MIELNVLSIYRLNDLLFNFCFSFFITFFLIPRITKFAIRFKILDVPDGKLKKHEKNIPYLGGLAVYLGFFVSLLFSLILGFKIELIKFILLLVGSTFLLILGLIDDLFVITPLQKFLGQCFSALFFIKLIYLEHYSFLMIPFFFFWLLSLINAFNLIDVMDGLASTTAIFASISFLIYTLLVDNFHSAILICSLIGSLLAFLYYNKPPAKIYLGDAGSLFIGGVLAYFPFLLNNSYESKSAFFIPFIILAIPILELIGLILIRTYKGIPFYLGSPDHFSIYLKLKGWTKNSILVYVSFSSLFLTLVSCLLLFNYIKLITFVFLFLTFLVAWCLIIYKSPSNINP